jgi:nicotinate-nucleotide pyrophosphorylase (carboxylating)
MPPLVFTAATERLIDLALEEDIGSGDITTDHLVDPETRAQATIIAKEDLIVAGLAVARRVFERLDPQIEFQARFADADSVPKGSTMVELQGRLSALLTAERTALNFLQRLSGIATHVRGAVQHLDPSGKVRLVDTRKTTPGWRVLEKYAVRTGGAGNHRMGLFDGVLIKDNHIAACGGITAAIERIRAGISHLSKIEVETSSMEEVKEALSAGADIIMLDNMDLPAIRKAAALIDGRALVEVSGGITAKDLPALAEAGVDLISSGALTHSARAVDISMRISVKS